jgi:hypothetical protein
MPFEYILADLLARNDGAVGVLFLDESGETVDLVCTDFNPHQLRVVGAYVGIYLRQARELMGEAADGPPRWLHIEKDALHIYVVPLPDGYYVVLVQRAPALVARARESLATACEQLERELFSAP